VCPVCGQQPGVSTPGRPVGSTAGYPAVSPNHAAQLEVQPGISRFLHTQGCSVGSTAGYLAVSPYQAAQLAVLPRYLLVSPHLAAQLALLPGYLPVSPHQAAQLVVVLDISRCLHTMLLSGQLFQVRSLRPSFFLLRRTYCPHFI
jgi:hypothetical protein